VEALQSPGAAQGTMVKQSRLVSAHCSSPHEASNTIMAALLSPCYLILITSQRPHLQTTLTHEFPAQDLWGTHPNHSPMDKSSNSLLILLTWISMAEGMGVYRWGESGGDSDEEWREQTGIIRPKWGTSLAIVSSWCRCIFKRTLR
jgi:hypothetical protein